MARLNREFNAMYQDSWRSMWSARRENSSVMELASLLLRAIEKQKPEHVRALLRPMTAGGGGGLFSQTTLGLDIESPSYLFLAVDRGNADVVKALLEAGGRELANMARTTDGATCLIKSASIGCIKTTTALLEVGGRELLMGPGATAEIFKNPAAQFLVVLHPNFRNLLLQNGGDLRNRVRAGSTGGRDCVGVQVDLPRQPLETSLSTRARAQKPA
jgi:hypothetical protein